MSILWITGNSGAGKTFTGDYLEQLQNFVHVEGDGGFASSDEKRKTAFYQCAKAFDFWFEEKEAPTELWHPHFEILLSDVEEAKKTGKNIVVTYTVYNRQVRDYLRNKVPELIFIQLQVSKGELIKRAKVRFENFAKSQGKSIEETFKEYHKIDYSEEAFEKFTLNIMRGLQELQKDELESGKYHLISVDDGVSYLKKILQLANISNFDEKFDREKISEVNYQRFKNFKK